jgi:hypothetical protein
MLLLAQFEPPTGFESWALKLVALAAITATLVLVIRSLRRRR